MTVAPIGTNEVDGIRTCHNCYRKTYVHNGYGLGTYCATLPTPQKVEEWTVCPHGYSVSDTCSQQADIILRQLNYEDFKEGVFKRYGKAKDFQVEMEETNHKEAVGFDY